MDWICVYRAANLMEAGLLQGLLEQHGIASRVNGQFAMSATGELPVDSQQAELWGEQASKPRADELLRSYENSKTNEQWLCDKCGEANPASFDFCWACG